MLKLVWTTVRWNVELHVLAYPEIRKVNVELLRTRPVGILLAAPGNCSPALLVHTHDQEPSTRSEAGPLGRDLSVRSVTQ